MKLSDFVMEYLAEKGVRHVFYVSGGAAIHLCDSASNHPQILPINGQHEEHSAAAADMYYRASGIPGVVVTTSGPGATNIVTSICNAFFDSIPMLCLTGQVSRFRIKSDKALRQKGFQETDVVSIFESITKYVVQVIDPQMIKYELDKAYHSMLEGRPGPVALDIPDDLQREEIDPDQLVGYCPPNQVGIVDHAEDWGEIVEAIKTSERPMLLYGAGVRCAGVEKEAIRFAELMQIPFALTWGAADIAPYTHPLNVHSVGVCGPRSGNFALQRADLIVAMGTRLSQMITGGKMDLFAPNAKKIMVDIDPYELSKFTKGTVTIDVPIQADLKAFFLQKPEWRNDRDLSSWREWIKDLDLKFPICSEERMEKPGLVDPYVFIKELSHQCEDGEIILSDTGANVSWMMQAIEPKKKQRILSAWNHTPMGYSLPASVGAACATGKRVMCVIGDGGFMMCLQELATIRRHNLPVKVFLFDNQGHAIQKQTMETWLQGNYTGADYDSGLYFPDYALIARSFGMDFIDISDHDSLSQRLEEAISQPGPVLCQVQLNPDQRIDPMLKFGAGIEDLNPKLSRDTLDEIMGSQISPEAVVCEC